MTEVVIPSIPKPDRVPNSMKQLVVMSHEPAATDGSLAAIASRQEMLDQLAARNTGPDQNGGETLYGPGIRLDMTPDEDPVTQMLLEIIDEDIGWDVATRLARELGWALLDPMSGRTLTF